MFELSWIIGSKIVLQHPTWSPKPHVSKFDFLFNFISNRKIVFTWIILVIDYHWGAESQGPMDKKRSVHGSTRQDWEHLPGSPMLTKHYGGYTVVLTYIWYPYTTDKLLIVTWILNLCNPRSHVLSHWNPRNWNIPGYKMWWIVFIAARPTNWQNGFLKVSVRSFFLSKMQKWYDFKEKLIV